MAVNHSPMRWLLLVATLALSFLASAHPGRSQEFPEIDRSRLLITLERSACFGSCPDYQVTIDGYGRVVFSTRGEAPTPVAEIHRRFALSGGVLVPGRHEDQIDPAVVDDLVEQFRKAGFFGLKDEYFAQITDHPTYVITIDTGHGSKQIVDYSGRRVGMPAVVTELENAVDEAAGTARWISGGEGLVEWLSARDFDFSSNEAAILAINGLQQADDHTLVAMVERGLPLGRQPTGSDGGPLGAQMLEGSLRFGKPLLFQALAQAGWLDRIGRSRAGEIVAEQAGGCSPELIDAAAAAGVPMDEPAPVEPGDDEGGKTALARLAGSYACADDAQKVSAARRLLAHGADPNRRDIAGETAIYGVESVELLELLLANGADATVKDNEGLSAVFSTWTDELVLRLLKAGASPEGHYFDGLTLREQARHRPLEASVRWLDENGRAQ